jgi:hypothetical protein
MRNRALAHTSVLAMLALQRSAFASDPPPEEIAVARRLFSDARIAEDAKDWPMATAKLRDAISIKETSGLRFHLAYCEEQQGLLVEALVDYERAEDLSADKDEDLRSQIPARRASLQKRIPTVTLLFAREPGNAQLVVDGRALASTSFGKAIPVNPGKHSFLVTSPGFTSFSTVLSLNETDAVVTNVVLAPATIEESLSTAPDRDAGKTSGSNGRARGSERTYVLVGEAAAALGALAVGIVFTLQGASEDERARNDRTKLSALNGTSQPDACAPPPASPEVPGICGDLAAAMDDWRRDKNIARIGFIGAGVGTAAFAATFFLWPSKSPQTTIRPWLGPGATGLSLASRF